MSGAGSTLGASSLGTKESERKTSSAALAYAVKTKKNNASIKALKKYLIGYVYMYKHTYTYTRTYIYSYLCVCVYLNKYEQGMCMYI